MIETEARSEARRELEMLERSSNQLSESLIEFNTLVENKLEILSSLDRLSITEAVVPATFG